MSEVPCPHECEDESHRFQGPVIKLAYGHSVSRPEGAGFYKPADPSMHEWPPCDGQCINSQHNVYIKKGMMKEHLTKCHGMDAAAADRCIADPLVARMSSAAIDP